MSAKITFPIGRLVWGSLYKAETTDYDGNPLTIKTGPDAGKQTQRYAFGVAIPKTGRPWWEESWGAEIFKEASASFSRNEPQRPDFSWKITDGDSTLCKKGSDKPINTKAGHAGHWVLSFSSSFPPKLYADNGTRQLVEQDVVKVGYFIQVAGTVAGNGNANNPGVFINHDMVNFSAYGEEIYIGADPTAVGFGGALPVGASATPPAGSFAPAGFSATPPAMPAAPIGLPAAPAGLPASPVGLPATPASLPAAPAPLPVPAPAPVIPAAPMLQQVQGAQYTIEQCRAGGWSDDQIVNAGYAIRVVPQATPAPANVVQPIPSFLNGPQ